MKAPFRIVETPAFTYIVDAEGKRICTLVTKETEGDGVSKDKWLDHDTIEKRAKDLVNSLNTYFGS